MKPAFPSNLSKRKHKKLHFNRGYLKRRGCGWEHVCTRPNKNREQESGGLSSIPLGEANQPNLWASVFSFASFAALLRPCSSGPVPRFYFVPCLLGPAAAGFFLIKFFFLVSPPLYSSVCCSCCSSAPSSVFHSSCSHGRLVRFFSESKMRPCAPSHAAL